MDFVSHTVRVSLPGYLASLPVPGSMEDVTRLSGGDWLSLLPFISLVLFVFYSVGASVRNLIWCRRPPQCNLLIRKHDPKVTDVIIREELTEDKVGFCRCWRSKKWPYCDGAHKQHNLETGDNVGALVIRSRNWSPGQKHKK